MRLLLAGLALAAVSVAVAPDVMAGGGAGPVEFTSDCKSGAVEWEYTNQGDEDVTLRKSRIVLPPELGYHRDTTLSTWDWTLRPGQTRGHGITGIIHIEEGQTPGDGQLQPMPDGKYILHVWLYDGVTYWFTKTTLKVRCS